MEACTSNKKPSFMKPALLFTPTIAVILFTVGVAKSFVGLSAGTAPSILLNVFIVGFVTWLLTKDIFKEINRELSVSEKVHFCLLTVVPLTIFQVIVVHQFILSEASMQMLVIVAGAGAFMNFCGVWLVISTMFKKIFKDILDVT